VTDSLDSERSVVLHVESEAAFFVGLRYTILYLDIDGGMTIRFHYATGTTEEHRLVPIGQNSRPVNGSARHLPKKSENLWQRLVRKISYWWRQTNGWKGKIRKK
jgi:hypothetical protein